MFTLTIQNQDETHVSVREWPSVDIIKKGSERFELEIADEAERLETELGVSLDSAYGVTDSYKAVLRSTCGEFVYFMTDGESAYVTNSSGKTVAVVR